MTLSSFSPAHSNLDFSASPSLPEQLVERVCARAEALHVGDEDARWILPELGALRLLTPGAPENTDGGLFTSIAVIRTLAKHSVSAAFTVWAHRVTAEFLAKAKAEGNRYAARVLPGLERGEVPGITGMASAFRSLAGIGDLDIEATPVDGGFELNGALRWASNQYEDAQIVTAANTPDGKRIIVSLPLSQAGVVAGKPFQLLSLNSTRSSFLKIDKVRIDAEQVLSEDFEAFLFACRPTFLLLQSSLCVGLAEACLESAASRLVGVTRVFEESVHLQQERLALLDSVLQHTAEGIRPGGSVHGNAVGAVPERYSSKHLLTLRLDAAELASDAAALELRCVGGQGYAASSPSSRRFREAAFIPVQSPSECQLRWELSVAKAS